MVITLTALYEDWEKADIVVEVLLDYGLSHTEISLMSGDHWFDDRRIAGLQEASDLSDVLVGNEVLLEVSTGGVLVGTAREIIWNSGPVAMRERAVEWHGEFVLAVTPVIVSQPAVE